MSESRPKPPSADVGAYFSGLADTYAQHRPDYPAAAFETMAAGLTPPVRAADIGCGTGISSRALAATGARVIGIDPNADMLRQAQAESRSIEPAIIYRAGSAEDAGLSGDSVDLVLCAQAFHWFDADKALAEFHRILVPNGRLALLWNVRQDDDAFTQGYSEVARCAQDDARKHGRVTRKQRSHRPDGTGHFTNVRMLEFDSPQRLDLDGLLGRARSASYFPREGRLKEELERTLRALFDAHQRDGIASLSMVAELTLADAR
jgi:ubiquinone/menaquinone biosynthesis C-methylase UbiE